MLLFHVSLHYLCKLVLLSIVLTGREKMREEDRELLTKFHLLFHNSYIEHAQNKAHDDNDREECLDDNTC